MMDSLHRKRGLGGKRRKFHPEKVPGMKTVHIDQLEVNKDQRGTYYFSRKVVCCGLKGDNNQLFIVSKARAISQSLFARVDTVTTRKTKQRRGTNKVGDNKGLLGYSRNI